MMQSARDPLAGVAVAAAVLVRQSIHLAHVASAGIDTNLFFGDLLVDTSGGASPVRCHGQRQADAKRVNAPIEEPQSGSDRRQPPVTQTALKKP